MCACTQWLNRMLQGMWPYYDKAIGAAIKEAVEPMMEQYKPPGLIKKIYFAKLTFGDAPIRIDNVWVEDEGENHVLLEVRCTTLACWSVQGHRPGPLDSCSIGMACLGRLQQTSEQDT